MTLRMLSLFSGIGGLDLSASWAGIETIAFCEIDKFCQAVLRKNFGADITIFDDVRTLTAESLRERGVERVDIVCGGFPCQDVSGANPGGRGLDGKRSGLWSEMFRLVREVQPRYVVVENVANLLNRGVGRVLGNLASVGLDAEWRVLSASQFGAPHRRERLFIFAYPPCERRGFLPRLAPRLHTKNAPQLWESFGAVNRQTWLTSFCGLSGNVDGVSRELDDDRFRALGNAVVPQVVYPIFEAIATLEATAST